MIEQWQELKETITELRDNGGKGTQQEVCRFLVNYMDLLEVHKQEPEHLVNESDGLVKDLVKDAISRKAVLSKIKEVCFSEEWLKFRADNGSNGQRDFLINYIEQLPPVTPQPKTGHWIDKFAGVYRCSCCREIIEIDIEIDYPNGITFNYCPNCGAKMKEAQK